MPNQPIQSSYTVTANDTQSGYNATTVTLANTAAAPSYDHDGNLNGDGARQMAFDGDGNLGVVVSASGARTEFVYDGLHRLRQRNEFSDPGGSHLVSQTSYAYDGRQPIQEGDHTGAHYVDYTLGRDLSGQVGGAAGIGGYLARTEDAQTANPRHRYFHADVAGNITGLLNDADNELVRYLYDPYGNLLGKWRSFADVNLIRHASKEYNVNAGVYLYPFRPYDPHFHRWLSQDPIGEAFDVNLYRFNYDAPPQYVDPNGKNPILIGLLAGAIWGAIMTPYNANAPGPDDQTYPPTSPGEIGASALAGGISGGVLGAADSALTGSPSITPRPIPDCWPNKGATIYRVYAGKAGPLGQSWTTVKPSAVTDFRAAAGLFEGNSGANTISAKLLSVNNVQSYLPALPGPTTPQGAVVVPELLFNAPPVPGVDIGIIGNK